MEIAVNLFWVVLGLVMLFYGAEWLVKGASEIAIKFGISPLIVGLTVVAFGTSAPELIVCVQDNLGGGGAIALANIVGSNICNIALVLGASAVVFPLAIHLQIIKREMIILIAASVVFLVVLHDQAISRLEGGLFCLGIVAYVTYSVYDAKGSPSEVFDDAIADEEVQAVIDGGIQRILVNAGLILVGIAFLFFGSNWLIFGVKAIAQAFHVPEAIIGLTVIAFGTSLPELATGIMASWKKQGDIVVGNAVGSCIFNLLAVGGVTAVVKPIATDQISWIDLGVMLFTAVLAWLLMRSQRTISRIEGGWMLAGYLVYTVYISFFQS